MPSGKTHDLITLALAPPVWAVSFFCENWAVASVATASFLFAGLMFGPDLDLVSKPYKRWGPFRFIWKPYQLAFKHRDTWTHGPVKGTIFRILYFGAVITLIATGLLWLVHGLDASDAFKVVSETILARAHSIPTRFLLASFVGLVIGSASHTFADVTWSAVKRIF